MTVFQLEQDRRVSLASAVDSNRRAVQLANDLYSRGLTDYLSVQECNEICCPRRIKLAQSEQAVSSKPGRAVQSVGGDGRVRWRGASPTHVKPASIRWSSSWQVLSSDGAIGVSVIGVDCLFL